MSSTRSQSETTEVRSTPGPDALPPLPWYVDPDDRIGMEWNNHIQSADGNTVCFMAHNPDDNTKLENATHLIAAAPDLLEVVQTVDYLLNELADERTPANIEMTPAEAALVDFRKHTRAAIAKATGAA